MLGNYKEKHYTSFIINSLFPFLGILFWGTFFGYDYVVHLIWEMLIVFFYVVTFVLFVLLPKERRKASENILGFSLFGTAILEIIHALFYKGFYTNHPGLSVEFWIYSRGMLSSGFFIFALLEKKVSISKLKKHLELIFPVITVVLLTLTVTNLIPENLFYSNKTTVWKTILELVYVALLFSTTWLIKENKYFVISAIFNAFGELSFVSYTKVFGFQFIIGHAFVFAGAYILFLWVAKERIFTPFKQLEKLAGKYDTEISRLSENIANKEKFLKEIAEFRKQLLKVENVDELKQLLKEKVNVSSLIVFHNGKIIHGEKYPLSEEEYETVEYGNTKFLFKKMNTSTFEFFQALVISIDMVLTRLNLQRELERLYNELREKNEFQERFMRSISHELKTPLNIIKGNIQLVEMGITDLSSAAKEIKEAVDHAVELVNNLLDLSKIQTGRVKIRMESVNFGHFEKLIREYKNLAKQKGLDFRFDFYGVEPFSCDYRILSTIISNLLSNAIKYTESGKIEGFLKITDSEITIKVSDTGKGISKGMDIFDPFVTEEIKGTGLGLSIVREFVKLLKGEINFESEKGKGTTFYVKISRITRPRSYSMKEHIQVLIVAPDRQTRRLLKSVLSEFSVEEATTGQEGYIKALEHGPDLIITTLGLPDISGDELIRRLEKERNLSEAKFVLYTGGKFNGDDIIAFEKGEDIKEIAKKLEDLLTDEVLLIYSSSTLKHLETTKNIIKEIFQERKTVTKSIKNIKHINDIEGIENIVFLIENNDLEKVKFFLKELSMRTSKKVTVVIVIVEKE